MIVWLALPLAFLGVLTVWGLFIPEKHVPKPEKETLDKILQNVEDFPFN